jgi:hypothetical protein
MLLTVYFTFTVTSYHTDFFKPHCQNDVISYSSVWFAIYSFTSYWESFILVSLHMAEKTLSGLGNKAQLQPLQRHNTENVKQIFLEKELRGHSPNFHIHMSVSDL